MGDFDIAFTGDIVDDDPLVVDGRIRFGEREETFDAYVGYWSTDHYRRSWIAALRRLTGGADTSCLLTSVSKPEEANFVTGIELYRFGDEVRVQDRVFFLDQHPDFDLDAPWESMDPYSAVNEDGEPISEWRITIADIEDFLAPHTGDLSLRLLRQDGAEDKDDAGPTS